MVFRRNDVLQVRICYQYLGIRRAFRLDAPHTLAQRLELLLDHFPVHVAHLSANTRVRYGMKSACSNKWRLVS